MVHIIILIFAFGMGSAQAAKLATYGNLKVEEVVKVRNGGCSELT